MSRAKRIKPSALLATGPKDYGALYTLARRLQALVRHYAEQFVFLLEALCARIETDHELRKWNRALERDT
jgi:hypothetical protein